MLTKAVQHCKTQTRYESTETFSFLYIHYLVWTCLWVINENAHKISTTGMTKTAGQSRGPEQNSVGGRWTSLYYTFNKTVKMKTHGRFHRFTDLVECISVFTSPLSLRVKRPVHVQYWKRLIYAKVRHPQSKHRHPQIMADTGSFASVL